MATKREAPALVDREKLLAACDDEPSFANRCLHAFVRQTLIDVDGIEEAFQGNDFLQIARLAHRIKGASASIRAEFLRQESALLEELAGKAQLDAADRCFARFKGEFKRFRKFVASLPPSSD